MAIYYPSGNYYTRIGTPFHIAQLVLLLIRETFQELDDDHPWRWRADFDETGIIIDTIFNKESEMYGKKPTIIVDRGDIGSSPVVLGDKAAEDPLTSAAKQTTVASSSVNVKVISEDSSAADILANEIFNFMITARFIMPRMTTIQNVGSITLSTPAEYKLGENLYYVQANMLYTMQYRWDRTIPQLLLSEVELLLDTPIGPESDDQREVLIT